MAKTKPLNVDVDEDLAAEFKAMTAKRKSNMRQEMTKLLDLYLAMHGFVAETKSGKKIEGRLAFEDLLTIFKSNHADVKFAVAEDLEGEREKVKPSVVVAGRPPSTISKARRRVSG